MANKKTHKKTHKKNFKYQTGDRVSSVKRPDAHGSITECFGLDTPLYLVRWDDTPNQLLIQFERELAHRGTRPQGF